MNPIIKEITASQVKSVTSFKVGDGVRVHTKVREGDKERVQIYSGIVIARKGTGIHETFTVRRLSYGEGVERVFPVHSPLIDSIEVVRRGKVRRAKLYYLRGRRGKSARIVERQEVKGKAKRAEGFKGFTKPKGDPDDLKLIQGVTPELEKKLNKLGLIKFEQIANLSDDEIARLDEELQLNGAIEHDDWVGKATDLMAETTVEEVPAEEEEGGEGEAETAEAAAEPKAEKAAKAKREKPAKQPKKS